MRPNPHTEGYGDWLRDEQKDPDYRKRHNMEDHKTLQPIPVIRNLPTLADMAPAVANELEQLAVYLEAKLTAQVITPETLAVAWPDMLGEMRGMAEVTIRNVRHQAKLLREAK